MILKRHNEMSLKPWYAGDHYDHFIYNRTVYHINHARFYPDLFWCGLSYHQFMNQCGLMIHILQGCFQGTGATVQIIPIYNKASAWCIIFGMLCMLHKVILIPASYGLGVMSLHWDTIYSKSNYIWGREITFEILWPTKPRWDKCNYTQM